MLNEPTKNTIRLVFIRLLVVFTLTILPTISISSTFTIANGDVPGLITAINTANANGEADIINLTMGGSYILTTVDNTGLYGPNGLPIITSQITINGNGAIIQRSSALGTPDFRILEITGPNSDLTVDDITISGGNSPQGGGILNQGNMIMSNSAVTGNYGHTCGGIYNLNGTLLINHSVIQNNTSFYYAGGVFNHGDLPATLIMNGTTVSENSTGGYRGGGIVNVAGVMTMSNCTVNGNTSNGQGAGGIFCWLAGSMLTMTNCTVSGNSGNGYAGGICNVGCVLTLTNCTVSDNLDINNSFGGLYNEAGWSFPFGVASVKNSIFANNNSSDLSGLITTLGHNLFESIGSATSITGSGIDDIFGLDPMLEPLADNGGPTQTHSLLPSSPAINWVPLGSCTVSTDQRGTPRPQGTACDIGAFERVLDIPPTITCPSNMNVSNDLSVCGSAHTFSVSATGFPTPSVVCTPASGSLFPVGTTTVSCVATNAAGSATCSFTITVNDVENPSISCPSNMVVNPTSLSGAVVTYTTPVGTDNCSGASTAQIAGLTSGSVFPIGLTTNTFVVTDASSNSATCTFTVEVRDPTCDPNKVYVCHNGTTICVNVNSLPAHLNHGDNLGECAWYPKMNTEPSVTLPTSISLEQNHPNPFTTSSEIRYTIANDAHVLLRVFDLFGREVKTIVNAQQQKGSHNVTIDGHNLSGGMYIYRLDANGEARTSRMMLVR